MALALEEIGFTRYGQQGAKPLFKNKPTVVNVGAFATILGSVSAILIYVIGGL